MHQFLLLKATVNNSMENQIDLLLFYNLAIVFFIGCICGSTEVLSRYKETKYIFRQGVWLWVLFYIIFNGLVSVLALYFIKYFRGQEFLSSFKSIEINNIFAAGFGGMMILRSSIFSINNNGKKIAIGLEAIVKTFLDTIERQIKNITAVKRVDDLEAIMKGLDFQKIKDELPQLCIDFVDNFKEEDSKVIKNHINTIDNFNNMTNFGKCLSLGRIIAMYCDTGVIKSLVEKNAEFKLKVNNEDIDPITEIQNIQDNLRI
ncbi:hypothetical protein OF897_18410 [Chryseobacterium formosus]|uniref:Uncharacterized protein n=1 Tax=Chryseobacterium formosus TaxID=1537363 RepID=A0ABT3XW95_9FLAO|nr:hypothetical protein [Chryseobacterium formosus]MCX8525891.1 hypothetical protein [Chryseobacterium formosus]